jgi:glutaredoxin
MSEPEKATKEKPIVTIYTAGHCTPCDEVKDLLTKGQFLIDGEEGEIDVIDIETDEGFDKAQAMELTAVPQAFRDGKECRIKIDDESHTILIECEDEPTEEQNHRP